MFVDTFFYFLSFFIMSINVFLSQGLRDFADKQTNLTLEAATVQEVIDQLTSRYAGLAQRLFREGKRNLNINYYVNNEDIRFLDDLNTPLKDNDQLDVIAGTSGG